MQNLKKKDNLRHWTSSICLAISFWFMLSAAGVLPLLAEYTDERCYFEFLQTMEDFVPEEDAEKKIEKDDWVRTHSNCLSHSEYEVEPIEHKQCDQSQFYNEHIGDIISPPPERMIS